MDNLLLATDRDADDSSLMDKNNNSLLVLTSVIGYLYVFCWSFSFYPQLLLNFKRQSAKGLSIDFLFLNFLGFLCYSVYNLFYFFEQDSSQLVSISDVLFSTHALFVTTLTILQIFCMKLQREKLSRNVLRLITFLTFLIAIMFLACLIDSSFGFEALVIYLGYNKVFITLVKYIPQVLMNYRNS